MLKKPVHFAVVLTAGTRKEDRGPIVLVSPEKKAITDWIKEERKTTDIRIVKEGSTYRNLVAIDAGVW